MSNGWTPERRAKQAAMIKRWKPWQSSTGPCTQEGKKAAAMNAYKGAIRTSMRALRHAMRKQRELLDELDLP